MCPHDSYPGEWGVSNWMICWIMLGRRHCRGHRHWCLAPFVYLSRQGLHLGHQCSYAFFSLLQVLWKKVYLLIFGVFMWHSSSLFRSPIVNTGIVLKLKGRAYKTARSLLIV